MNAEIIYLYAFDIAQEADLPRIEALMPGTAKQHSVGHLKDAPLGFPMYRPIAIRDEAMSGEGPRGPLTLFTSVKLFAVGAMSIKVRLPVTCESLMDLQAYRDLRFTDGTALEQRVAGIARQVFEKVKPGARHPRRRIAVAGTIHGLLRQHAFADGRRRRFGQRGLAAKTRA